MCVRGEGLLREPLGIPTGWQGQLDFPGPGNSPYGQSEISVPKHSKVVVFFPNVVKIVSA